MLQQITALEIRIRMDNHIELARRPTTIILDPLNIPFMRPFEDAIARNMVSLLLDILPDAAEHIPIVDARGLQQAGEVVEAEMAVRTAVRLARARRVLGQDLLAGEGRVAAPSPRGVPAHIPVRVPDVVPVFFVELVVRVVLEALSPEQDAVVQRQADAFQEEGVLQPAEMLQVAVLAQRHVQVAHAGGEVRGEGVDAGGGDGRPERSVAVGNVGVGRGEVFGQMRQDRGEAVVFVEAGQRARSELRVLSSCKLSECTSTEITSPRDGYLQAFIQPLSKARKDHTHLFPRRHIRFARL